MSVSSITARSIYLPELFIYTTQVIYWPTDLLKQGCLVISHGTAVHQIFRQLLLVAFQNVAHCNCQIHSACLLWSYTSRRGSSLSLIDREDGGSLQHICLEVGLVSVLPFLHSLIQPRRYFFVPHCLFLVFSLSEQEPTNQIDNLSEQMEISGTKTQYWWQFMLRSELGSVDIFCFPWIPIGDEIVLPF